MSFINKKPEKTLWRKLNFIQVVYAPEEQKSIIFWRLTYLQKQ